MLPVPSSLLPILSDNILVRMIRKYAHKLFQGPQYKISIFTVLVKTQPNTRGIRLSMKEKYTYIYICVCVCVCVCVCGGVCVYVCLWGKEMKPREGLEGNVFL